VTNKDFSNLMKSSSQVEEEDDDEWDMKCWKDLNKVCILGDCMSWVDSVEDEDGETIFDGGCAFILSHEHQGKSHKAQAMFYEQATAAMNIVFGVVSNIPMGVFQMLQARILESVMGVARSAPPQEEDAGEPGASAPMEGEEV